MAQASSTSVICPGCGAALPPIDGPTHRYIGASAPCWAIHSALVNAGEPPMMPAPHLDLIVDAYAAQHPGIPSPQSIQSVAVHLLALYSVFVQGTDPANAVHVRARAVRGSIRSRRDRFTWLEPPNLHGGMTVAQIAAAPTPVERTELVKVYVEEVWARWAAHYAETVAAWYAEFVVPDRL